MTKERIKKLEQIGVQWMLRPPRAHGSPVAWEARFEQLKQYQVEHGDCNVPQRSEDDPRLGVWVMNQKAQLRKYEADPATSSLSAARMPRSAPAARTHFAR